MVLNVQQPPATLRANDTQGEQETVEIAVTRLLLKSYYDIVRKNIQDLVPKAIMHFLVCHRPLLTFKLIINATSNEPGYLFKHFMIACLLAELHSSLRRGFFCSFSYLGSAIYAWVCTLSHLWILPCLDLSLVWYNRSIT